MLAGQLGELPAGGAAAVEYLDGLPDGFVRDGCAGNLLQLLLDVVVLVHGELQAEGRTAVLRMGQENAGQLLAHGAQGVADGGGDDAVQLVQRAVQQHLQRKLGDGAVEGGAVLLGQRNGLFVAAPDGHGDHAGGINQLLRGVVGQNADDLLALLLVGGQQTVGVLRGLLKFPNQRFDAHYALPSFAFLASMASTKPCTRVSYWASLKLRGSAWSPSKPAQGMPRSAVKRRCISAM